MTYECPYDGDSDAAVSEVGRRRHDHVRHELVLLLLVVVAVHSTGHVVRDALVVTLNEAERVSRLTVATHPRRQVLVSADRRDRLATREREEPAEERVDAEAEAELEVLVKVLHKAGTVDGDGESERLLVAPRLLQLVSVLTAEDLLYSI